MQDYSVLFFVFISRSTVFTLYIEQKLIFCKQLLLIHSLFLLLLPRRFRLKSKCQGPIMIRPPSDANYFKNLTRQPPPPPRKHC